MASLQNISPAETNILRIVNCLRQAVIFITGILVSRGHILGTATNDAAAAGEIGEIIAGSATPAALTTATGLSLTSIVLTPGHWSIYGSSTFIPAATTTITRSQVSISTVTNTIQTGSNRFNSIVYSGFAPNATFTNRSGPLSQTVAAGTTLTLFWVAQLDFAISTATANAVLQAYRIR